MCSSKLERDSSSRDEFKPLFEELAYSHSFRVGPLFRAPLVDELCHSSDFPPVRLETTTGAIQRQRGVCVRPIQRHSGVRLPCYTLPVPEIRLHTAELRCLESTTLRNRPFHTAALRGLRSGDTAELRGPLSRYTAATRGVFYRIECLKPLNTNSYSGNTVRTF